MYPTRVGAITAHSSEEQLAKIYGKQNLAREVRSWGDDGYRCATVLFRGTEREVTIFWGDGIATSNYSGSGSNEEAKRCQDEAERRRPYAVEITASGGYDSSKTESYWNTKEGIHAGITLLELERINGAPIDFESSDSCFDGGVSGFHNGTLEKHKDLLSYSRVSYPREDVERFRRPEDSIVSSKGLSVSLKKRIYLETITFSFPAVD